MHVRHAQQHKSIDACFSPRYLLLPRFVFNVLHKFLSHIEIVVRLPPPETVLGKTLIRLILLNMCRDFFPFHMPLDVQCFEK